MMTSQHVQSSRRADATRVLHDPDAWGNAYDPYFGPGAKEHWRQVVLDRLGITEEQLVGKVLLDAGTGPGQVPYAFTGGPWTVIAIDTSQSIFAARQRLHNALNVSFARANIASLRFLRESLDFVFCLGVLHHTPAPGTYFRSLAEAVKPGGRLFVFVMSSEQRSFWMYIRAILRPVAKHLPQRGRYLLSWLFAVPLTIGVNLGLLAAQVLDRAQRSKSGTFAGLVYGSLELRSLGHVAVGIQDAITFEYYSQHSQDEVLGWFREAGFESCVSLEGVGVNMSGVKKRSHA